MMNKYAFDKLFVQLNLCLRMGKVSLFLLCSLAFVHCVILENDYKVVTLFFDFKQIKTNMDDLMGEIKMRIDKVTDTSFNCTAFNIEYNVSSIKGYSKAK